MESCLLSSLSVSGLIAFLYVGSLYCWPNQTYRDDPKTIKRRFLSVFITCFISTIILVIFNGDHNLEELLHTLGIIGHRNQSWTQLGFDAVLLPLLQTSVLFIGPIVLSLKEAKPLSCCRLKNVIDLIFVRNYMIAPITEEFIFRGVLSAVLLQCWSLRSSLVISSLEFGFAHSHHYLFEKNHLNTINGWAAFEQMVYTSFFGMYASLLYFRSKLIVTPILVHSFCNFMGLPDFQSITSSTSAIILTIFGLFSWVLSLFYVYFNL